MRGILRTVVILLAGMVVEAGAGISSLHPWAILSDDETRILVMRLPGGAAPSHPSFENPKLSSGEEIDFVARFPKSGVYRLSDDGLVYQIDWFCLWRELMASPDLVHLVRMNRFGGPHALTFFKMGAVTATYSMDDLLTAFRGEFFRPFTTWDYHHAWCERFEMRGNEIVVTTVTREAMQVRFGYSEVHRFEFLTGDLVETEVKNGWVVGIVTVGGVFLAVLFAQIFWMVRKRRRRVRRVR